MTRTIRAIYENGVLRPLEPLPLPEHSRVDVTVDAPDGAPADSNGIRGCIGILPDSDAAEMTEIIQREFGRVDEREW